ncbi:MAG: cobalamin-binding protein, partial [Lentisphaeria bacterium]|nr:cobalamin-binding protein [Lentisphaeria bacterium]
MIRPALQAFLIFVTALILNGCGKAENTQKNTEIRAVSLAPALTELVFHLGGGDLLCGRTDACTVPAQAAQLPVAG